MAFELSSILVLMRSQQVYNKVMELRGKRLPASTKKKLLSNRLSFISRVCRIPPHTTMSKALLSTRHYLDVLRAIKRALFPKHECLRYDLEKTAVELARLSNEIKGYIAELASDFSERERRTFAYAQMEPQNRFVSDVVRHKTAFLEQYAHCRDLYPCDQLAPYRRERDETIRCGRALLNEIEATTKKLPLSVGQMGL